MRIDYTFKFTYTGITLIVRGEREKERERAWKKIFYTDGNGSCEIGNGVQHQREH